eukprot:189865-Pleurochrysis_carterae.AAC.1
MTVLFGNAPVTVSLTSALLSSSSADEGMYSWLHSNHYSTDRRAADGLQLSYCTVPKCPECLPCKQSRRPVVTL